MTQLRLLNSVLLVGGLLAACGTDDKAEGADYSGGDSAGEANTPGADTGEDGADVEPTYPTQHPRIYIAANKARLKASLSANTEAASRFKSTVDSFVAGQDIWEFRIWNVALMGQLTGSAQYCQKAVADVDAFVAGEEAKIAAGTQPQVAHDSYLAIGDLIGDLALTYDWCFDTVTPAQKTRWLAYANQAVWNVWNPTQAKWGSKTLTWSGWSTNNPANNYYYSFLRATMLLGLATKGETPQGDEWIKQFRETKVLGQLVPTFDEQLIGGGSREGTAYGVSMRGLWHLYDLWTSTTGEKLHAKTKHARRSMRTFMHQVMPTIDKFAPTGDQPRDATCVFFDYQRAYLEELVALYPNDPVAPRAKKMLEQSNVPKIARPEMLVYDFLYDMDDVTAAPLDGMGTSHYASGIGQVYSRSGWDKSATWVNLIAGAYTESHAHQDQGALMIFKDGWLMADAALGSKNGLMQETTAHSLVRINSGSTPIKQVVGTTSKLVSLHGSDDYLYAAADLTPAYKNNPAITKVQREVVFLKPNVVVVYDRVASGAGTSQVWQLASPIRPTISGANATIQGTHTMTVQRLAPANASGAVTSMTSLPGYLSGFRFDENVPGGDNRYLHVLSLDGGAASAVANGDTGVTVTLSNGSTAQVEFNRDDIGATLTLDGQATTLATGVDMLPE
ncbi:MAG: hypothetical protein HOV81_05655 [Kofleriaceae bacterium]|nr:hypothetical protein [Kofleriaceae bacterium]